MSIRTHDDDPTTPGGAALRHPDDPLPLAEAFDRAYPYGPVCLDSYGLDVFRANHKGTWRPAPWHTALLRERARWDAEAA